MKVVVYRTLIRKSIDSGLKLVSNLSPTTSCVTLGTVFALSPLPHCTPM